MAEPEPPLQPKVLQDPVHNLITLPAEDRELMLGLIDRPEFQRLRRIRQLGVSFLTYPGAEHSRWVHSLGVQHVARQMLDTLQNRFRDRSEYKEPLAELEKYRREILVAALLHDVGHGPFSHLFERAIPAPKNAPGDYPKDHEGWSERIIRECFAEDLVKKGINVEVVTGLIDKKNREHLLAKDFINSQLDADRMDYLLRDSRATGPKYGEFDLPWLLHALRIGKVRIRGQEEGVWRLCFDSHKAVHAVEEYIQAREFMYVQVYIHKTTRAYEAMLRNILELAQSICQGDPGRAPQPCPTTLAKMLAGQVVGTSEYRELDDFRLWSTFVDWSTAPDADDAQREALRGKCARLVNRRKPYRSIDLDNRDKQDKALELVTGVKDTPLALSCHRDAFTDVAYRNIFYRKSREDEEEEDRAIFFVEPDGQTRPAESLSPVIDAISKIETQIYRLYYDGEDADMIAKLRKDGWLAEDGSANMAKEEPS
jgi:HD superfamily phosphohydrolase